ncbi:melanoma-associated antigen B2-like [Orcinus orca]|uniref:melanoma-associated antigen B2-like n=1 Tax=Orcinus orca TaxID=9733 RepID=UPI002111821F|nr:melanoma-associated antigen B2-like [Orcinus orca]
MPRGQKSKLRAREERRRNRGETQGLNAQATTAGVEETTSSPVSVSQGTLPSSAAAGTCQEPQGAPATSSRDAGVSCPGYDVRAKGQVEESKNSSQASTSRDPGKDLVTRKAGMLVQFMLCKYKRKEPIKKGEKLKIVNKRYREHFPEIPRRASECMELVFGLELKEVKPNSHSYALVGKLDLTDDGRRSSGGRFRKNGPLMPLLGVIFLHGDRASEEEIWESLNVLGVFDGRRHFILVEPRKLITEDLVQERCLEYRQVPSSDPPCSEFLWGLRARAETSKMKVLEVLDIHDTVPTAFPPHNEEALRDEGERARARAAARAGTTATAVRVPGPHPASPHTPSEV